MAAWSDVVAAAPDLAARVAEVFSTHRHHTMATVRADGSPRVSGTEVRIEGGLLAFGVMAGAVRTRDLRRDPRVALHSQNTDPPVDDPSSWPGEAKVSGRALPIDAPTDGVHGSDGPAGDHFAVDVETVVLTTIGPGGDHLVIEWWTPSAGVRRVERF